MKSQDFSAPPDGSEPVEHLSLVAPPAEAAPVLGPELDALVASAKGYAAAARAAATRKAYAKLWAAFELWCKQQGLCAFPAAPQTVALYLAARADQGRKVSEPFHSHQSPPSAAEAIGL